VEKEDILLVIVVTSDLRADLLEAIETVEATEIEGMIEEIETVIAETGRNLTKF
jgi:hypothetical protein